jgi:hypothetical protein
VYCDVIRHVGLTSIICVYCEANEHNQSVCQEFGEHLIYGIKFRSLPVKKNGPGSSVGIATGYGLDGSRIESRWGRSFSHTSRTALGPTQPPVQ